MRRSGIDFRLSGRSGDTKRNETAEKHRIKIVKLTENFRTQPGIRSVEFEGEILAADPDTRDGIEFIGDSITCGFGNDMQGENGPDTELI